MLKKFEKDSYEYLRTLPYPYMYMDNALETNFALDLQKEILNLDINMFDRYDNPFESKYTLRDKYTYPPKLSTLMNYLTSDLFVDYLSSYVGCKLYNDTTRNFWGVHLYDENDKLDIHVDAGIHPTIKKKKQLTLGIYLSYNYHPYNGCELEIWDGDSCSIGNSKSIEKLNKCIKKISPLFNRLIMFNCTDNAWHGNPTPLKNINNTKRIFITISYLSDLLNKIDVIGYGEDEIRLYYLNNRQKALFIKLPNEPDNEEKDKLRKMRVDPDMCKDIYRIKNTF